MRYEEERGGRWLVSPGDPAAPLANRLKRLGVEYVVLPARTYRSGVLETTEGIGYDSKAPPDPSSLIRSVRLADCCHWLSEEA